MAHDDVASSHIEDQTAASDRTFGLRDLIYLNRMNSKTVLLQARVSARKCRG
jgi:hypothetical protein